MTITYPNKPKKRQNKLTDWKNEPQVEDLIEDLNMARSYQQNQLERVGHWKNLYHIKNDAEKVKKEGRSGYQDKLIKRISTLRSSILQAPFNKDKDIFKITPTHPTNIMAAYQHQVLLNHQFNNNMNKRKFIDDLMQALTIEGTAILRISWEYAESSEKVLRPKFRYRKPTEFEKYQLSRYKAKEGLGKLYKDAILQMRGHQAIGKEVPEYYKEALQQAQLGNDPSQDMEAMMQMADSPFIQSQASQQLQGAESLGADPAMLQALEQDSISGVSPDGMGLPTSGDPLAALSQGGASAAPPGLGDMGGLPGMPGMDELSLPPQDGNIAQIPEEVQDKPEENSEEVPEQDDFELNGLPSDEEFLNDSVDTDKKNIEAREIKYLDEETLKYSLEESERLGEYIVAIPSKTKHEVDLPYIVKNCPSLDILNIEDVYLDPTCRGDMEKAKFCVHSFATSLSELKSQSGLYKNLDKLEKALEEDNIDFDDLNQMDYWRDHGKFNTDDFYRNYYTANFKDIPRKRFLAYEYWGYWDIDKTGIVKPIVATFVGDIMIRLDENPFPDKRLPFVTIPYYPIKDSFYGEPDAELLEDHQKILTAVCRMINNTSARIAAGQIGIAKNFLDSSNRKLFEEGKTFEFNAIGMHPNDAIFMRGASELPQSLFALHQHTYKEAESLVGINTHISGMDQTGYMQPNKDGEFNNTYLTQIESALLNRISYGLHQCARKIIAMNSEFINTEQMIPITGSEFQKVTPEDLKCIPGDICVNVSLASIHDTAARLGNLMFLLQTVGPNLDPEEVKGILAMIAQLSELPMLAEVLYNHKQQPNPMEEQMAQAQVELVRSQAAEHNKRAEEHVANSQYLLARAEFIQASTAQIDQQMDMDAQGVTHARQKDIMESQAQSQGLSAIAKDKDSANKGIAEEMILNKNRRTPETDPEEEKKKKTIDNLNSAHNTAKEPNIPDGSNLQLQPDHILNNMNPFRGK